MAYLQRIEQLRYSIEAILLYFVRFPLSHCSAFGLLIDNSTSQMADLDFNSSILAPLYRTS